MGEALRAGRRDDAPRADAPAAVAPPTRGDPRRVPVWAAEAGGPHDAAEPALAGDEVTRVLRTSPASPPPRGDWPNGATVHRGPAVDAALHSWHAGAATLGQRVFLPDRPAPDLVAHELTHLRQNGGRDVDLTRPVSVGAHGAPEERDASHRGDPQVLRRSPPRVETPAWPPQPAPPEAFAPTGDRHDAEGNLLAESAGTWYLAAAPTLNFPIAAGYRYSLLPPNPNASFTALHRRCEQVRDEQLATARRLHGTGNYWFAKVYYFVTVNELANIDQGVYQYPHMKMQEVMAFNATYAQNLRQWEAGNRSAVEPNWRRAFAAAADPGSWLGASKSIANALLPAMEAHIRFDLPRAIAAVFDTHYAGIPGATLDDFRSDFFAMAGVFDRAAAALNPEIDAAGTNLNPANWQWAGDAVFPFIFSVPAEREHAWEKARTISGFAGSDAALESRLHSEMGTAHPNFDSFDVDGGAATGYRWGHQPGMRRDTQPGPVPDPAPPVPALPDKIFFQLNLPDGVQELPDAVRSDQDLRPLLALAAWTRQVSGAVIVLTGHASSEGAEHWNANLSDARCVAVEHFLFRASADLTNNRLLSFPRGEQGASPTPQWRNVELAVLWPGHSKHTTWGPASNLPSEVR